MRSGGSCSVQLQQGLSAEAAGVVKQAVTLAKRRGHAQVTPLHVANTMLASPDGLLRSACLQSQSHSHPLQCKALELCFNVALNRLPASSSSPPISMLAPTPTMASPSISNALVAAFKRAQAHQRRGSIIDNQQPQPLLVLKIELEQLIISILDDPSVSRVMREAGFSSTQVKINVEQAVSSLELSSQKEKNNDKTLVSLDPVRSEDVRGVIDGLIMSQRRKRRSTVVVGECVGSLEGVVRAVMDKVEMGDVDHEGMRGVKFISLSPSAFGFGHNVSKAEVENKMEELKILANTTSHAKGFILYLGDLKWVFEYRASSSYSAVEHMIMEVGKLVSGINGENNNNNNNGRFRVMGIATFQTYMRCKNGHPSLEAVWGLHPLTIPAASLSFSLITTDADTYSSCGLQNQSAHKKADNGTSWLLLDREEEKQLAPCFTHPSARFRSLQSSTCNSDPSTTLPAWLQRYKNENRPTSNDQNCVPGGDLCKRWNSMCSPIPIHKQSHPNSEKTLTFSSVSPTSSTTGFSYNPRHQEWQVAAEPKQSPRDHSFWISESGNNNNNNNNPNEPTLRLYIPQHNDTKQPFPPSSSSNPSTNPNSTSSSEVMETEYVSRFKEVNSENLKTLCNALEEKVPWQKHILPDIVSTILRCRSGMLRRKGNIGNSEAKEETWLFFEGADVEAKEQIGRELGRLIFGGSHSNNNNGLVSIGLSSFSSTRADSTEDEYSNCRNKRSRDEQSCISYAERLGDAVSRNPHRVFMVEDIEEADYGSQMGLKRAIERGSIADSNGRQVCLGDAIIILSCESFSSRSRACSPDDRDNMEDTNTSPCVSLDLNISIHDDRHEDRSVDAIGLLESVDRRVIFKTQEF